MLRFFFKLPRHKRFDFKPRFYDADREALNMRIKAIQSELGAAEEYDRDALRGRLSHSWRTNTNRSAVRKSNRNVIVIAFLLFVVAYLVLYT